MKIDERLQKQIDFSLEIDFDRNETSKPKFVRAMNNFQSLILNDSNNGSDLKEHGVKSK